MLWKQYFIYVLDPIKCHSELHLNGKSFTTLTMVNGDAAYWILDQFNTDFNSNISRHKNCNVKIVSLQVQAKLFHLFVNCLPRRKMDTHVAWL